MKTLTRAAALFVLTLLLATVAGRAAETDRSPRRTNPTTNAATAAADETACRMIAAEDLSALNRYYPTAAGELSPEVLLTSRVLCGLAYNRLDDASEAASALLGEYAAATAARFGEEFPGDLIGMMISESFRHRRMDRCKEWLTPFLDQQEDLKLLEALCDSELAAPREEIVRPHDRETRIPLALVQDSTQTNWFANVAAEVNGCEEPALFDTGASMWCFASERYAEKHGARIIADSLLTNGVGGTGYTRLGYVDSLRLGDVLVHNARFIFAPAGSVMFTDDEGRDHTIEELGIVIGNGIMADLGRIEFRPAERAIVVPLPADDADTADTAADEEADEAEMLFRNGQYYVWTDVEGVGRELMQIDTGAAQSGFNSRFYEADSLRIRITGRQERARQAGFGGTVSGHRYICPEVRIRLGGNLFVLQEAKVDYDLPTETGNEGWGAFGADFVARCKRFTMDFRRMRVRAVPAEATAVPEGNGIFE